MTEPAKGADVASGPPLSLARDGAVAVLTIDRPQTHNALNRSVVSLLQQALAELQGDGRTAAIVLTGAGTRAFSAGADLDELAGLSAHEAHAVLTAGQRVLRLVETSPVPIIAAVNGVALGGGMELALACSIVLGSDRAAFGLPESGLGLIPGYGGTQRLQRVVGRQVANYIMLTGRRLTAHQAHAAGLLALPPAATDGLLDAALEVAGEIAARSRASTRAILSASALGADAPLETGLALESALAAIAVGSPDAAEGVSAFKEKRRPDWGAV